MTLFQRQLVKVAQLAFLQLADIPSFIPQYHSNLPQYLHFQGLKFCGKLLMYVNLAPWGQCYNTFYHGDLLPFHGNYQGNVVL